MAQLFHSLLHNNQDGIITGIVLWGTKNIYCVSYTDKAQITKTIECRLKGKRGKEPSTDSENRTFLLAGDKVLLELTDLGYGLVLERIERTNSILRRKHDVLQPIAVNIDVLLITDSISYPQIKPHFIDRLIYIAKVEQIEVVLIINKIDLLINNFDKNIEYSFEQIYSFLPIDLVERLQVYQDIGVQVIFTSVLYNKGIETVNQKIANKKVAIVGQSGVGKSSLINALMPGTNRTTGAISQKYNRGKHITTRPELIQGNNFYLTDTPGISDLYPTHADITTLIAGYPDLYNHSDKCKLTGCSHRNEPGCAIIPLIGTKILEDRYHSYVLLRDTIEQWEKNKWNRQKR